MTELEKYEIVNKCETIEELIQAILTVSGGPQIQGRTDIFDAERMSQEVENVVKNDGWANVLTRKYGIRQQALYIKYYQ